MIRQGPLKLFRSGLASARVRQLWSRGAAKTKPGESEMERRVQLLESREGQGWWGSEIYFVFSLC